MIEHADSSGFKQSREPISRAFQPRASSRGHKVLLSEKAGKSLEWKALPRWISAMPEREELHDTAFRAGAVTFALDLLLRSEPVFLGTFRQRLALQAAVAASRLLRVSTDGETLRDALHLTRPGDEPGIAARVHAMLLRFVETPTRLVNQFLGSLPDRDGMSEIRGLLVADLAQAERLGWSTVLPLHLLAAYDPALRRGDDKKRLRLLDPEAEAARLKALVHVSVAAHRLAVDLVGRADRLAEAAQTLRTREATAGLAQILAKDCVAPWRMAEGMGSDRAARRFCENLAAKGALRLLTPRATFRLYGL